MLASLRITMRFDKSNVVVIIGKRNGRDAKDATAERS
jgi:hypothetical protein